MRRGTREFIMLLPKCVHGTTGPLCPVCAESGSIQLAEGESFDDALAYEGPCPVPPPGWYCTRGKGHDGPCAAWPRWWNVRAWRRWH